MTSRKPKAAATPPPKPEPGKRVATRAVEARKRLDARPPRAEVQVVHVADKNDSIQPPHADGIGWQTSLMDTFGTSSPAFVSRELALIGESQRCKGDLHANEERLNAALAAIDGTRPENEMAAMLASQMAACHALAMEMIGRSRRSDYVEHALGYAGSATKLMRTFAAQTETLAKLKRGGEQTVRVEHVHVHPGAQAIVGAVTNHPPIPGGGATQEIERQPHETIDARALAFSPGTPVWGPDESRVAVPASCGDGEDAVQATRRRPG